MPLALGGLTLTVLDAVTWDFVRIITTKSAFQDILGLFGCGPKEGPEQPTDGYLLFTHGLAEVDKGLGHDLDQLKVLIRYRFLDPGEQGIDFGRRHVEVLNGLHASLYIRNAYLNQGKS